MLHLQSLYILCRLKWIIIFKLISNLLHNRDAFLLHVMCSAKRTVEAKPPAGQTVTGFLTLDICTDGTTSMEFFSVPTDHSKHSILNISLSLDMLC